MTLIDMPKIELHLHLEGAAPPDFIRSLAREKKVDIGGIFDENGAYKYKDFWDFLKVYEAATTVLKTPQDFYRLTRAVLAECAANQVIYAETFLAPDFCGGGDVSAWKDYLAAIEQAAQEMQSEAGVILKAIPTCVRHFGPDQAKKTALCASETAGRFVTGFGMGGDETFGTQGDFAYAYDMAREAQLQLTSHAGEWGGAESVRDAIHDLGVTRIGHGVRAIEDDALIEEIIEKDVVLEVCPGSNIALGVYDDLKDHPIARLRKRGVKVTVSTDDPPFFHTTMRKEFGDLAQTFGWDGADFKALNQTALEAAFCDDETRKAVAKQLETIDE
ncbi:adenosine deaminase [Pacificibacter maritimus]|uniref:Adenosine deaminase n=1 Tax=Pacificibacter maritimus TaxID=762213 RepID=A0A3N4V086_9RHOB|nr:adenosine deaminase [Pacificibacter maritimus]RPE66334.1 adenosine deaminase [Pacificibacter maritimus]